MPTINFIEKYSSIRDLGLHSHNHWEIIYVISGDGKFFFSDGKSFEYNKGDVICIPPHLMHRNYPNAGFSNINMTLFNWTPGYHEPILISNLENQHLNYVDDLYYLLDLTYRRFHYINQNRDIIDNLTELVISFIDSLIKSPNISIPSKIIETRIVSEFGDPYFDLNTVYEEFPYSKRHVQRLFYKDFGITPLQFLIQQRLNASVKYLNQTIKNDYSISEIAERSGFNDQYYFSRVFKKQFGICPKKYQKTRKFSSEKMTPPPEIMYSFHIEALLSESRGKNCGSITLPAGFPLAWRSPFCTNALSFGMRCCVL